MWTVSAVSTVGTSMPGWAPVAIPPGAPKMRWMRCFVVSEVLLMVRWDGKTYVHFVRVFFVEGEGKKFQSYLSLQEYLLNG